MTSAKEKQWRTELFQTMLQFPDLPVIPMVSSEVVPGDYFMWWMGHWGPSRVGKYICVNEMVYTDDDDDIDVMTAIYGYSAEDMPDEEYDKKVSELPWTDAILLRIDEGEPGANYY